MDKTGSRGSERISKGVTRKEAETIGRAAGDGSDPANLQGAWIREDGAICFGNECVVIKSDPDGALNLEIHPDDCGAEVGSAVLEHLIKSAGKGVHIVVPASEVVQDKLNARQRQG